jgi:heterodisulfide reductase subunit C
MAGKKNFGFDIQTGRQIDLDRIDTSFADEWMEAVNAWSACINCGSCVATCTAGQNGGLNFRQLHYKIRRYIVETDHDLSLQPENRLSHQVAETDHDLSLRNCFLCGKCQLVCPRGIPTRYLAIQIMQRTKHLKHNAPESIPSV